MLNRSLLAGAFLFFMPAICEAAAPNVVVVMADDIGLGDIGFYHRERTGRAPVVATPNIDALIHAGIRFSDAHSPASLCAPTRFSMLTGNYSFRIARPFGVWSPAADSQIDPDFTTSLVSPRWEVTTRLFSESGVAEVPGRMVRPTIVRRQREPAATASTTPANCRRVFRTNRSHSMRTAFG